jgi:hypothetical protein
VDWRHRRGSDLRPWARLWSARLENDIFISKS